MIKRLGTVAIACVLTLSACSAPHSELAAPLSPDSTAPASETDPSECTEVSEAVIAAVNATVISKGEGNTITDLVGLRWPVSGMWLVAGAYSGALAEGERPIGIWATDDDVTSATFDGTIWAVEVGAGTWSDAPYTSRVAYDPFDSPVLRCWDRTR